MDTRWVMLALSNIAGRSRLADVQLDYDPKDALLCDAAQQLKRLVGVIINRD